MTLLEAWLKIFLIFPSLSCAFKISGVSRDIALDIDISDTDINDAICSEVPKSTDTQVSSDVTSVLMQVVGNCGMSRDQFWHLDCP
jgi:hypothetical protein